MNTLIRATLQSGIARMPQSTSQPQAFHEIRSVLGFGLAVAPYHADGAAALHGERQYPQQALLFEMLCQRSEEHTSELQSLMRISYAVFCLKKKITKTYFHNSNP